MWLGDSDPVTHFVCPPSHSFSCQICSLCQVPLFVQLHSEGQGFKAYKDLSVKGNCTFEVLDWHLVKCITLGCHGKSLWT